MSTYFNGTVTKGGIIGGVSGIDSVEEELTAYEEWLNSQEADELVKAYKDAYAEEEIIHSVEVDEVGQDVDIKEDSKHNKLNIVLDFDNTIVDTNQAICDFYNNKTNSNIKVEDIKSYTLTETLTKWTKEQIDNIFCEKEFFDMLKPIDGAIESINKMLEARHTVKIATCHNPRGIGLKYDYTQRVFPMIDEIIFIVHKNGVRMNKSSVYGDILIDDNIMCLESCQVKIPICFGDYSYNKDYKGLKVNCWEGVMDWIEVISLSGLRVK